MKNLFIIVFIFLGFCAKAQKKGSEANFKIDFAKALHDKFSEGELNKMFNTYSGLLTPHSDVTQLSERLRGHIISEYPLSDFKKEKLYIDNIGYLLNSHNAYQRILSYLVIASSGDVSKESILLKKIKIETQKGNLIWAGMALLYLNCNHTTALFDFLVKNEDFGDAHMLPLFIKLNKDSLQQTAYNRINGYDPKAKVLAAEILSVTPLNDKTEQVLKNAVVTWDFNIKGFAIYSIKELRIGDLLDIFKPFLDSLKTRAITLEALANSPTKKDRDYLYDLVVKQDTVREELLDCFYKSKRVDNIEYWLKLLCTKNIQKNYVFFVFQQPTIATDTILPELQTALLNIKDPEILGELVRALAGRTDDKSVDIMIGLLQNNNSTVRYWTAKTLEGNPSTRLKSSKIQDLIVKGLKDGN